MLRDNTYLPPESINFLWDDGGIGDAIARISVVKYVNKMYPHVTLYVYVPNYFLELAKHFVPGVIFRPFSEGAQSWNKTFASRKTSNDHHGNMKSHLVDNAFHILTDKQVEIEHKNYVPLRLKKISIKKFNLPEKYVVVTTGFTAEVREMIPEAVNGVVDYVISKGYTPVFLGSKVAKTGADAIANHISPDIIGNFKKEIDYSKGIDLIDKTTLLEAGKILGQAKAVVGLDNGLLHLAGCSDVPIVGGFTTVEPIFRMPYRHDQLGWNYYPVVPTPELKCRFCQSNWEYVFNHDFKYCWYKDLACTKMLKADLYIKELEKIL